MEFSQIAVLIEPEHEVEAVRRMKRKMLHSGDSLVEWQHYESKCRKGVWLKRPLDIKHRQLPAPDPLAWYVVSDGTS